MFFDGSGLVGEPALTLPNQRLSLHWLSQLLTKSSTDFSSSLVLQIESSAKLRSWESVWRLECWRSTLILATKMMRVMLKSDEDEEGWNYPRQFPPPRPNLCSFPGKLHQISQQISNISQHELEVRVLYIITEIVKEIFHHDYRLRTFPLHAQISMKYAQTTGFADYTECIF